MKKINVAILSAVFGIVTGTVLITTGLINPQTPNVEVNPNLDSLRIKIAELKEVIEAHGKVVKTDSAEVVAYSHHKWTYFPEKHSEGIIVTWPDGSQTIG